MTRSSAKVTFFYLRFTILDFLATNARMFTNNKYTKQVPKMAEF